MPTNNLITHPPLWAADLGGDGTHAGNGQCFTCKKNVPADQLRYGRFSPLRPFEHYCSDCVKGAPHFTSYEDAVDATLDDEF